MRKNKKVLITISFSLLLGGCIPMGTNQNKEPEKNVVKPISGNVWDSRECLDWNKAGFPLDDRKLSDDEQTELVKKMQHLIPGVQFTNFTDYYLINEKTKTLNTDLVENYRMCGEHKNLPSLGYNSTYGLNSEKNRVITEIFKRGYDITGSKITDDEMKQALPAVKSWIEGYVRQTLNRENATINLDVLDYREKGETSAYVTVNAVGDIPKFHFRFPLYMDVLSSNPAQPKIVGEPDVETEFKANFTASMLHSFYQKEYQLYQKQLEEIKQKYGLEMSVSILHSEGINYVGIRYQELFSAFVNHQEYDLSNIKHGETLWMYVKDKKTIVGETKFNEIYNDLTKGLKKLSIELVLESNYYVNTSEHAFWIIDKETIERRKKLV